MCMSVHVAVLTISEQRAVGIMSFVLSGYRATITLVSGQISIFSEYRIFGKYWAFGNIDMAPTNCVPSPLATKHPPLTVFHLLSSPLLSSPLLSPLLSSPPPPSSPSP